MNGGMEWKKGWRDGWKEESLSGHISFLLAANNKNVDKYQKVKL